MTTLLRGISESYTYLAYDLSDERTRNNWPGAITLITLLVSYIYFVKRCGPEWMKNKSPYVLKNTIFLYNVFQIIISGYLFVVSFNLWLRNYRWCCEPVDYRDKPEVKKAISLMWIYMMVKLIDLLDTVFFVLRKKNRQISTLHVYHHSMMPVAAWIGYKYYPTGHAVLLGVINCFVHTIMYTYYLLAGLGPKYQKYLWWKKYVTILQLVQFLIIFFHNIHPMFIDCEYPKWVNVVLSISSLQFVYMFGKFYYVNYIKNETNTIKQK